VDRGGDGAALGDRHQQLVVLVAVLVEDADVVAGLDPGVDQAGCQLGGAAVELAEGAGAALEPAGREVGVAAGAPTEGVGEGEHAGRLVLPAREWRARARMSVAPPLPPGGPPRRAGRSRTV